MFGDYDQLLSKLLIIRLICRRKFYGVFFASDKIRNRCLRKADNPYSAADPAPPVPQNPRRPFRKIRAARAAYPVSPVPHTPRTPQTPCTPLTPCAFVKEKKKNRTKCTVCLELVNGIEPSTCSLRMSCSAIEPHQRFSYRPLIIQYPFAIIKR